MFGSDKSDFQAAVDAAKSADAAVVVVGEHTRDSDEGAAPMVKAATSLASISRRLQEELIQAVVATGTPTVVVLINGRPLSIRWEAEHVPAIVEAWNPGERGGEAVADVLFGDYNPTGRLAISIPRSVGQLPAYYNYKPSKAYWMNRGWTHMGGYVEMPGTPLYPFGHGMSYTNFRMSNLRTDPPEIDPAGTARVSVDVENTGAREGDEIVQLYIHDVLGRVSTPVKQLRGFRRVSVQPGETKTVDFALGPEDLSLLDRDMHWVVEPGDFEVMVGGSSEDIRVKGVLHVKE